MSILVTRHKCATLMWWRICYQWCQLGSHQMRFVKQNERNFVTSHKNKRLSFFWFVAEVGGRGWGGGGIGGCSEGEKRLDWEEDKSWECRGETEQWPSRFPPHTPLTVNTHQTLKALFFQSQLRPLSLLYHLVSSCPRSQWEQDYSHRVLRERCFFIWCGAQWGVSAKRSIHVTRTRST